MPSNKRCRTTPLWAALLVAVGGIAVNSATARNATPATKLPARELEARLASDLAAVTKYRKGLRSVLRYMRSDPVLFPAQKLGDPRVLTAERKQVVFDTWKTSLDYVLALDSLGKYHESFHKLRPREMSKRSFMVGYAAFVTEYAFAMAFIEIIERDPGFDTLLDEPLPDLGLPGRTYATFKFRFLNVARATEFGSQTALQRLWRAKGPADLQAGLDADKKIIWRMGKGTGPMLTGKNALKIVKDKGFTAWFPVQAGISEWMGDVKVRRKGVNLVSQEQIVVMGRKLEPGDLLLERREWHLSNIGLPGFWPHVALYVGNRDIRRAYFSAPDVRTWVKAQGQADGDFEALLRARHPATYDAALAPLEDGHVPRVIEAMAEGVIFTTLEHSAEADSVAVLRPRLARKDKAGAILRAFSFVGKPYDFDFDFVSDAAMVCTEVVYKSYQPGSGMKGVRFPLSKVMGHAVTPANLIAQMYDEEYGKKRQLDLVHFLDGIEQKGMAVESGIDAFRESWKRPKWHILTQKAE